MAFLVFWQYDPVRRKLDADASFMLYAGQQILRGHAPYVGVGIVKLPVSPLVAATGIAAGRVVGIDDILAGRIAFALSAAVSVGTVFFIGAQFFQEGKELRTTAAGETYLDNALDTKRALFGSFAAAVLLSYAALGVQVAEGPEAKLPMIAAGLISIALLARKHFFAAGIAAALSFMAWQPGLVFIAAALVCALVGRGRRKALVHAAAGVALPLVLIGAYIALNGAFASMLRQTFGANANYLGDKKVAAGLASVVVGNVTKIWDVSVACSPPDFPLVLLGYAGMLCGAGWLVWRLFKTRDAGLFLAAFPLLLSGVALFGFSLLDLQACSDVVVLLPYLALGAAAVLFLVTVGVARLLARVLDETRALRVAGLMLVLAVTFFGAADALRVPPQNGLPLQRELVNELAVQLEPQDVVQQFGDTVVLVVTGRENATRFVHLGEKQGLGILSSEGVSMDGLVQQLQAANPRLITLSRAKNKEWAAPIYAWIEANYVHGISYGRTEGGTQAETDVWWRKSSAER